MLKHIYNYNAIKYWIWGVIGVLLPVTLLGQLGPNYWTLNYGTKAQILNGAVIGGVDDNSAIFYNPAAIGANENGGISFSLLSPSLASIRTNSEAFNQKVGRDFDLLPNMAIINFSMREGQIKFSFGYFSRQNIDFKILSQYEQDYLALGQKFIGISNFKNKISERWYTIGWSYALSKHARVGITQNFITRSHSQFLLMDGNRISNEPNTPQFISGYLHDIAYSNYALHTKLGVICHWDKLSIGLSLSTPRYLPIYTSGHYQIIRTSLLGENVNVQEEITELGLSSEYNTPWSFGFGSVLSLKENEKIYFSTEYFTEVDPFTIIRSEKNDFGFALTTSADNVWNFALGYENHLSKKFTLLTGFRTDINSAIRNGIYYPEDRQPELMKLGWNVYHFSIGGHFDIRSFKFSGGIDYAVSNGSETNFQNPYVPILEEFGLEEIKGQNEKSRYSAWTFFLNYSLLFDRIFGNGDDD